MPRFDRFVEQYREAEAESGRDLEQIYNARSKSSLGQQLKVGGDYPDLAPHAPVHDAASFAWAAEVEGAAGVMRSELARYIAAGCRTGSTPRVRRAAAARRPPVLPQARGRQRPPVLPRRRGA